MNGLQTFIVTTLSKTHTYRLHKLKASTKDHTWLHHPVLPREAGKWGHLRGRPHPQASPPGTLFSSLGIQGPTISTSWPILQPDAESRPWQDMTWQAMSCVTASSCFTVSFSTRSPSAGLLHWVCCPLKLDAAWIWDCLMDIVILAYLDAKTDLACGCF